MKKLLFLIIGISLLFTLSSVSAYSNVTSCMTINSAGEYHLINDLITSGTCFTINSDDVILDCQGHTVSGDGTGNGFHSSGFNNITVKNCIFSNFSRGILIGETNNFYIFNNSIWNCSSHPIDVGSSNNITVRNNNCTGTWTYDLNPDQVGYRFERSSNILVENNYGKNLRHHTWVGNSTNATIKSNFAENCWFCYDLDFGTNNTSIRDNYAIGTNTSGLLIYDAHNTEVVNNTIQVDRYGVIVGTGNNTFRNNTIFSEIRPGFYLTSMYLPPRLEDYDNDIDTSNTANNLPVYYLKNVSGVIDASKINTNILIIALSKDVSVKNVNFDKGYQFLEILGTDNFEAENISLFNGLYCPDVELSSGTLRRVKVSNCYYSVFPNSTLDIFDSSFGGSLIVDIYLWGSTVNLTNSSYSTYYLEDSELYRKWYFTMSVKCKEALTEARVRIKNALGQIVYDGVADYLSLILPQYKMETHSDSITVTNYTPYTVEVYPSPMYKTPSPKVVDLDCNKEVSFSLSKSYGSGELFVLLVPTLASVGVVIWAVKGFLGSPEDWRKLINMVVVIAVAVTLLIVLFGVI